MEVALHRRRQAVEFMGVVAGRACWTPGGLQLGHQVTCGRSPTKLSECGEPGYPDRECAWRHNKPGFIVATRHQGLQVQTTTA